MLTWILNYGVEYILIINEFKKTFTCILLYYNMSVRLLKSIVIIEKHVDSKISIANYTPNTFKHWISNSIVSVNST